MVCKTDTGLICWGKHFWFHAEFRNGKYVVIESNCQALINLEESEPDSIMDAACTRFAH